MADPDAPVRPDRPPWEHPSARELIDQALALLAERGHRRTPLRRAVVRLLAETAEHLTVSQVYERIGGADLSCDKTSVHRALVALTDLGICHPLPTPGSTAYGLAAPPHDHAICTRCGWVERLGVAVLAPARRAASAATGFAVHVDGLALLGLCPRCSAGAAAAGEVPGQG